MFFFVCIENVSDNTTYNCILFYEYMMKDIILFGVPGCGKGTQAELLLEKLGGSISHLSTGDVFRAIVSQPNAIGKYVKNRMES